MGINFETLSAWVGDLTRETSPPGSTTDFVSSPDGDRCCEIGIVHEHRFAFYHWARYSLRGEEAPILITLDSHDDVGVPGEVDPQALNALDLRNGTEIGLFCWFELRSLNDGHILPALHLGFFSDVHVLLNADESIGEFGLEHPDEEHIGRDGSRHRVRFHRDAESLLRDLPASEPLFLDIDLDYFACENREAGKVLGSQRLRSEDEIRACLSLRGELMSRLLDRVVGVTIALEPRYCGGLANSLRVLEILNQEFFGSSLCTDDCRWRLDT